MFLKLCQLKSLVLTLLLLPACASWKEQKRAGAIELLPMFSGQWFKSNSEHSLVDTNGVPQPHLFFDVDPEYGRSGQVVNVVITTPAESDHQYLLDLSSGQTYYSHTYCKQKDIWRQQSGTFSRPSFSIGHIPRALDQLGHPQKVIVFGDSKRVQNSYKRNYFRTRLIGAFVEQSCPEGNCQSKDNWLSRLVFIGVLEDDSSLAQVQNIEEFTKSRDWGVIKATLENMEGHNFVGGGHYPHIKVGQLIDVQEALNYFKNRSILFSSEQMKKVQNGCHLLYERLWTDVGVERLEDRSALTPDEFASREKLRQELRKKKRPAGFGERFIRFTRKYADEMATCEKFVYHGNLNHNLEKYWFLSHVGLFYRLHKAGYYYDCQTKAWKQNITNNLGRPIYEIKREIGKCKEEDLDRAMSYLPNFLMGLKTSAPAFFKFFDYDNHSYGSHSKLYSWVRISPKRFQCSNDPNEKMNQTIKVYPEEVKWKERAPKDSPEAKRYIF